MSIFLKIDKLDSLETTNEGYPFEVSLPSIKNCDMLQAKTLYLYIAIYPLTDYSIMTERIAEFLDIERLDVEFTIKSSYENPDNNSFKFREELELLFYTPLIKTYISQVQFINKANNMINFAKVDIDPENYTVAEKDKFAMAKDNYDRILKTALQMPDFLTSLEKLSEKIGNDIIPLVTKKSTIQDFDKSIISIQSKHLEEKENKRLKSLHVNYDNR